MRFPVRVSSKADRRRIILSPAEEGRKGRDDLKGRKVISEVISEHERENGKQLECVYRVPVIDGSRFALSDGDYASGVVQLCACARTMYNNKKTRRVLTGNKYALGVFACTFRERASELCERVIQGGHRRFARFFKPSRLFFFFFFVCTLT